MALKRDLKGILFLINCYNLMQIATWNANSEQSMNGPSGSKNYWELNDPESRVVNR